VAELDSRSVVGLKSHSAQIHAVVSAPTWPAKMPKIVLPMELCQGGDEE
jgi:hypothetical protein